MSYRIEIDRSLCSGFGSCVEAAPATFTLGDDGIAVVHGSAPENGVLDAVRGCPMGAIAVFDSETGERVA